MAISAKVTNNVNNLKAKVTTQDRLLVTSYAVNASNIRLGDLFDVSVSNPVDGSFIVYNASSQIWEATVRIDRNNQIISGGNY